MIFDLDGTVIDSHAYTFAAFRHALSPWDRCPTDAQIHAAFGPPERVILGEFVTPDLVDQAYQRLQSWYRDHVHLAPPHPEMPEVLGALQEQGIVNALFTGRAMDSTSMLLRAHDLERFFEAIIAGDSPVQPKPSGQGVTALVHKVGCSARRSLVVGDSLLDLQAARHAGVAAVGVAWFPGQPPSRLEAPILSTPRELLQLIAAA